MNHPVNTVLTLLAKQKSDSVFTPSTTIGFACYGGFLLFFTLIWHGWCTNKYVVTLTTRISVEYSVPQCDPGHVWVHSVKRTSLYAAQTTSECGLRDQISVRSQCVIGAFIPILRATHLWSDHPGCEQGQWLRQVCRVWTPLKLLLMSLFVWV